MPNQKKLYRIDLKDKINATKTCFFTGHRNLSEPLMLTIADRLEEQLLQLVEKGFHTFLSGGALGFDLMAARAVLELRKRYAHLRLIFVLPCMDHTAKWRQADVRYFQKLLALAGESVCLYGIYHKSCMRERNVFMAQHAAYCISALRNNRASGTAQAVRLAVDREIPVHNLLDSALLAEITERHKQTREIIKL